MNQLYIKTSIFFLLCLYVVIKGSKSVIDESFWPLDLVIKSAPNFFYTCGIILLLHTISKPDSYVKSINSSILITCGALLYEIEQSWVVMIFDLIDIIAILLGFLFTDFIFRGYYQKTKNTR